MKKPTRTYVKKSFKYWNMRKINRYSNTLWYSIVIAMGIFITYALISWMVNKEPLVSPLVLNPVTQVEAKEPSVVVSCETPQGYLECKAYQHEITWEEHDLLSRIIKCESGWNPEAINTKNKNSTYDRGLFQSNSVHIKTLSNDDAFNFKKNIDWGIKLFKKQGTSPWNSSWKCWVR